MKITKRQEDILHAIAQDRAEYGGFAKIKDIALAIGMDVSNARREILKLESMGLVKREKQIGYFRLYSDKPVKRECIGWSLTFVDIKHKEREIDENAFNETMDRLAKAMMGYN